MPAMVEPSGLEPELSCVSDRRVKPVTPGLYNISKSIAKIIKLFKLKNLCLNFFTIKRKALAFTRGPGIYRIKLNVC